MNKQQLTAKIWEAANNMRSKIDANEYKDFILGFMFYKYLSEKEIKYLKDHDYEDEDIVEVCNEDDSETVELCQSGLGYFIAYKDLFSTWLNMGHDFTIDNVRTALSSFSRLVSKTHENLFRGIFNTLETGLSKLGENAKKQSNAAAKLVALINEIPMNEKRDYDILGYIYENLISMFAQSAGKKAGEFYTPHEVSLVMSNIIAYNLKDQNEISIYDPTSGSGSLLINIGESAKKYMDNPDKIKYYAQEINSGTYNLTRMNLIMKGIKPSNIEVRNADTLSEDWPVNNDSEEQLTVDAVVSNPPYSAKWTPEDFEHDPRYAKYGLAPKSKADYAFLLHDLYHVKPGTGLMAIVLPHGVLFRGGEEGNIRKHLIEYNNIDTIIGLPADIFYGTGIPTIIMILRKNRPTTDVLIIDASKGFVKEKKNKLRACDIRKITDTVIHRLEIPSYSRRVSKDEIRANDYNLNIPRYVDTSEKEESYDIYASMFGGVPTDEINELSDYWRVFPSLKDELFTNEQPCSKLKTKDVRKTIENNKDVKNFLENYKNTFKDFKNYLKDELIDHALNVSIEKEENTIADYIFDQFKDIPIVDKYMAFESFSNNYITISGDLEIIQNEGLSSIKVVEPNLVVKTKNKKEVEVQEGWKGHILPFDLVQKAFATDDLKVIEDHKNRLEEIPSEYEEILNDLSEDDKELISDALNDTNDAFVMKNIKNVIKTLKKDNDEDSLNYVKSLQKVESLYNEEKKLKKDIRSEEESLHLKTKDIIENLSDEQVVEILMAKWINPIYDGIIDLPNTVISNFEKQVSNLANKYSETLADIDEEIRKTEHELSDMLSQLTGSESDMAGIKEFQKLLGGL